MNDDTKFMIFMLLIVIIAFVFIFLSVREFSPSRMTPDDEHLLSPKVNYEPNQLFQEQQRRGDTNGT